MKISTVWAVVAFGLIVVMAEAALAGGYAEQVRQDEPVAYWRLDETDGQRIEDATGHGNHGQRGDSVEIGVDGLIGTGHAVRLQGGEPNERRTRLRMPAFRKVGDDTRSFTVEFWYRPAARNRPHGVESLVSDGRIGRHGFCTMVYHHRGHIRSHVFTDEKVFYVDSEQKTQADTTYHIASVYDHQAGTLTIWLNGEPAGTVDVEGEPMHTGNGLVIGADNRVAGPHGIIDEVAIYDYPLKPARIRAHFDAGRK